MMGVILLAHTATKGMPITDETMIETHLEGRRPGPYVTARINPCSRPFDSFDANFDWAQLARRQQELFDGELRPILDAHPSWPIVYFGLVPIPLAVHLGAQVGQMRAVEARLHHYENRDWRWPRTRKSWCFVTRSPRVRPSPDFFGPVSIRVSATCKIEPTKTQAVVETPFSYDVRSRLIKPDSIRSSRDLESITLAYKDLLEDIVNALPNASMRHLFASIPVGLAFRLGTVLKLNSHLPFQTWKHMSRRRPEYRRAILIGPRVEKPRVLVLAASPPDTPSTTAIQEVREVHEILRECGPGLDVVVEEGVTRERLPDLLREIDPTFIHFAGHGRRGVRGHVDRSSRDIDPALVVHHNASDHHARPVGLDDLTRWIGERPKRVLLLTACHSNSVAEAAASTGSVCIGFRDNLRDGQARAFARAFWKSLRLPGQTVDMAFRDGLAQMDAKAKERAFIFPPEGGASISLIPRGGIHV